MKILISPAKSLDFESKIPTNDFSEIPFLKQTKVLSQKMDLKSKDDLKKLMNISDQLAELNYQRFQDFSFPFTKENARQAVYSFSGDVYKGLDVYTLPEEHIDSMQNSLRILSGFYGLLKPLDLIQPYRLEMGTSLKVNSSNNLYEFWGSSITDYLNQEMAKEELLVNLASKEYFKAVQSKKLKATLVTPIFKDYKNGKLKIISFFAKKARGQMARYILDNGIETLNELKGFDIDGYGFSAEYTLNENEPVFVR
ncbi:peroxide stress protein YaaA [Flavobacteriaceae bacterium]|nr:peroxide stress protein YaaA [Flavobacteriaceae bacterium]